MQLRALTFDVFGTLLDWRSTIASAFRDSGLEADPDELADDWRARALAATQDVNQKQRPWAIFDRLHETTLGELLDERGLELPNEGRASLRDLESAQLQQNDKFLAFLDADFAVQQAQLQIMRASGQLPQLAQ